MSEKIWLLKRCDLFQRLPPEALTKLELRCRARKFPRGSPIYLPADEADGALLLTSGRAKICSFSIDGKQAILALIEPGELFGELAVLGQDVREEYAEAAEKSSVLLIPADAIQTLMTDYPDVSIGITKLFGFRRRRVERRLKYLLFRSNRQRLIHLLLELTEQYGRPTAAGVDLGIKLSHQELANIIGSTRETVTVVLGELQAEGSLEVGRRKIVIRDLEGLAKSVQVPTPSLPGSDSLRQTDRGKF